MPSTGDVAQSRFVTRVREEHPLLFALGVLLILVGIGFAIYGVVRYAQNKNKKNESGGGGNNNNNNTPPPSGTTPPGGSTPPPSGPGSTPPPVVPPPPPPPVVPDDTQKKLESSDWLPVIIVLGSILVIGVGVWLVLRFRNNTRPRHGSPPGAGMKAPPTSGPSRQASRQAKPNKPTKKARRVGTKAKPLAPKTQQQAHQKLKKAYEARQRLLDTHGASKFHPDRAKLEGNFRRAQQNAKTVMGNWFEGAWKNIQTEYEEAKKDGKRHLPTRSLSKMGEDLSQPQKPTGTGRGGGGFFDVNSGGNSQMETHGK